MRQQLTSGGLVQADDEDVESFANRLRNIANRASYRNVQERLEVCLNAFLNGVKVEVCDHKLVAAPGAKNYFDIAVAAARKFEK